MKSATLFFGLLALGFGMLNNAPKPKIKGYVPLGQNLWAAQHEVTNQEYKSFLEAVKDSLSKEQFKRLKPDTAAWESVLDKYYKPFTEHYFQHPAYRRYPVVNVAKTQMLAYCQWRTQQYHQNPKRAFKKVQFRLPDEQEWLKLASPLPGHNLPWYGNLPYKNTPKNHKLEYLANLKLYDYTQKKYTYYADDGFTCAAVGSYPANQLEAYDLIGNVAELTQEGVIKGGSWDNTLAESTVEQNQNYVLPDPRVGFRVVMEVLEE
jgi:formylglycine-generating enzyme required for sulfatase activity